VQDLDHHKGTRLAWGYLDGHTLREDSISTPLKHPPLPYDEIARTSQSVGALNTLPLELQAMQTTATTPVVYALGALTTGLSLAVVLCCLLLVTVMQRRRARHGSDAGQGV
jgi:hypothetical protein